MARFRKRFSVPPAVCGMSGTMASVRREEVIEQIRQVHAESDQT